MSLQNQWLGSVKLATSDNALNGNSQNYAEPRLPSYDVLDVTVNKRFAVVGRRQLGLPYRQQCCQHARAAVPVGFGYPRPVLSHPWLL